MEVLKLPLICRSDMEKLKSMVDEARNNKSTKSNKILNTAQEGYNAASNKLNAIESAVSLRSLHFNANF
jgi:hypothetical protein